MFSKVLIKYQDFLKGDGAKMVKTDKYQVTQFLDTFSELLRAEIELLPLLPSNSYETYVKRFTKIATGKDFEASHFSSLAGRIIRAEESRR